MSEKQESEKATAEGFLNLFNEYHKTDYRITEIADAPDVRCKNATGESLNLEITLTEDRPGDIKAILGRSDQRDIKNISSVGSRLSQNVLEQVRKRIKDKATKRYGPHTALVIRDTSGVNWDWNNVAGAISDQSQLDYNPFDNGVWILNLSKTKIFRVL